jgi:hypothetical protein
MRRVLETRHERLGSTKRKKGVKGLVTMQDARGNRRATGLTVDVTF